jgi:hypothetical protein
LNAGWYLQELMEVQTQISRWSLIALTGGAVLACAIGARLIGRRTAFSKTIVEPRASTAAKASAPEDSPVVLELFTSEGCSSCPPADELLSKIGSSSTGVIPLAYHVDYWDSLGWSDPFSSGQWTARQAVYVREMELSGSYTPQIVINGRWQCVGSDPGGIARAIAAARTTQPPGVVTVRATPPAAGSHKLNVSLSAHMLRTAGDKPLIVLLAIYENGLVAKIGAGENSGHQIRYDYTVRKIVPAFELNATAGSALENEFSVDLDPSWNLDHLGVAAFIQDENSLAIDGAVAQYPIAKN